MRAAALLFAIAVGLAGCGSSATTPLTHAIAALRAGDRAAFVRAKAEADAARDAAWQPGMDRCKFTAADFQSHGEAALVDRLDQADLFKLPEEARFVYTANIVGKVNAAMVEVGGSPLIKQTWLYVSFAEAGRIPSCPESTLAGMASFGEGPPGEMERRAVLKDWLDSLTQRYGAAQFDNAMHNAVAQLDRYGFVAKWPAELQFEEPPPKTFGEVQAELDGHR